VIHHETTLNWLFRFRSSDEKTAFNDEKTVFKRFLDSSPIRNDAPWKKELERPMRPFLIKGTYYHYRDIGQDTVDDLMGADSMGR
jgi:hypothetical protein